MKIKSIRNDDDLRAALLCLEPIFQAQDGIPEADERDVLVTLIEAYEQKQYALSPVDTVKFS